MWLAPFITARRQSLVLPAEILWHVSNALLACSWVAARFPVPSDLITRLCTHACVIPLPHFIPSFFSLAESLLFFASSSS